MPGGMRAPRGRRPNLTRVAGGARVIEIACLARPRAGFLGRMPLPPVDYLRTSRRARWADLPAVVHAATARAAGSAVVEAAIPVESGFTNGYAAPLLLADGRRVFVKAAGPSLGYAVAGLAQEATVLPRLASLACAPRLVGVESVAAADGTWWVLVLEHIDGHQPGGPWTPRDAWAAHDACAEIAAVDPGSLGFELSSLVSDVLSDTVIHSVFDDAAAGRLAWPVGVARLAPAASDDASRLLGRAGDALLGDRLSHADLRADNLLISAGRARVLDWNWVSLAPGWADFAGLLPYLWADGIVPETFAAGLLDGVDPEAVDSFLAVLAAYLISGGARPDEPGMTPSLRQHQRYTAQITLDLLARRRRWPA